MRGAEAGDHEIRDFRQQPPAGQHIRHAGNAARLHVLDELAPAFQRLHAGAMRKQLRVHLARRVVARIARPAFGREQHHFMTVGHAGQQARRALPESVECVGAGISPGRIKLFVDAHFPVLSDDHDMQCGGTALAGAQARAGSLRRRVAHGDIRLFPVGQNRRLVLEIPFPGPQQRLRLLFAALRHEFVDRPQHHVHDPWRLRQVFAPVLEFRMAIGRLGVVEADAHVAA
ncbi:hypothetical protein WT02_16710 [Burkholderia stagnalis]|nr:hypothetical protein WT03_02090 [Burkholderia stagnalis]KVL95602.1 hypothetical protein WT02_16710 [Burkholderia stagnalis]KVM14815.1 hypothetical protein WT04_07425 [Burkholderia stagnalis]